MLRFCTDRLLKPYRNWMRTSGATRCACKLWGAISINVDGGLTAISDHSKRWAWRKVSNYIFNYKFVYKSKINLIYFHKMCYMSYNFRKSTYQVFKCTIFKNCIQIAKYGIVCNLISNYIEILLSKVLLVITAFISIIYQFIEDY